MSGFCFVFLCYGIYLDTGRWYLARMKKILYNHKWHFKKQECRKFRRKQEKGK